MGGAGGSTPSPTPRAVGLGVLAVLALALIAWFVLAGGGDDPDATPPPSPTDTATDEPDASESLDGPSDDPASVDPLDELEFVAYGGVELPVHPEHGPTQIAPNGRASGFDDSELGVALAAVHLGVRSTGTGPLDVIGDTIREQFVASRERDQLLAEAARVNRERVSQTGDPNAPAPDGELVGYRVTNYVAGESAVVDVLSLSGGTFGATTVSLVRVGGEWKAQAPAQGLWINSIEVPVDPSGFTVWKDF